MEYDLHVHTCHSRCSNLMPQTILKAAKKRGLDGIAITDHHEIEGAVKVRNLNKDRDFEVIVGEEVSTNYGDVLLYYLSKKINKTDFFEVVDEARKQGALVIIPHPFRVTLVNDHKFRVPIDDVSGKIDAIETFNARMMFPWNNCKAAGIARRLEIAVTAGSDAHFAFEIGTGRTLFEGSLKDAIRKKRTSVCGFVKFGAIGGLMSYIRKRLD